MTERHYATASKYDCQTCRLKPRCCPKEPARYVPRSIYAGARDMARQIARSSEGRIARRLRKKVEMLFAHLKRILKLDPAPQRASSIYFNLSSDLLQQ